MGTPFRWWNIPDEEIIDNMLERLHECNITFGLPYCRILAAYVADELQELIGTLKENAESFLYARRHFHPSIIEDICKMIMSDNVSIALSVNADTEVCCALADSILGHPVANDIDRLLMAYFANIMDRSYAISDVSGFLTKIVTEYRRSYPSEYKLLIGIVFGSDTVHKLEEGYVVQKVQVRIPSPLSMTCELSFTVTQPSIQEIRKVAWAEVQSFKKTLPEYLLSEMLDDMDLMLAYIYETISNKGGN